jgi:NADH-quinone oxidoreductase subunit N
MNSTDIARTFEGFFDHASAATAPLVALGVGVLLFLICDIVPAIRAARPLVFVGTIVVAALSELRILQAGETVSVLGGSYIVDPTTAIWGLIFLASSLFAWLHSVGYYRTSLAFKGEHDALLLGAPAGMMLMVGAGDLVTFFIGLELLSIPLYALAAFRRARATSVEAGLKYFLLGAFGSGLFLYGASLLYAETGTITLQGLLAADLSSALAVTGAALVFSSLLFKVSVFPFHLWVPDVYEGSPTPITALMATGTKAAAFGVLVKVVDLLPADSAALVALLALLTMAAGNLGALVQTDVKRLLAYSGVAHAGTLLLVLAAALGGDDDPDGARVAALYYMGAYLFTALGAFGVLALLESDGERFTRLDSLRGLARSRPELCAALTLFLLSLGGIPATGGFLGKWFVFAALVRANMILVAVLGVLLSVVALAYYLRIVVALWMQPPPEGEAAPVTVRPLTAGLATAVCCALVLAMGLVPGLFLGA